MTYSTHHTSCSTASTGWRCALIHARDQRGPEAPLDARCVPCHVRAHLGGPERAPVAHVRPVSRRARDEPADDRHAAADGTGPADSMAFRPELAGEVRGTVWHWVPGDNAWTHRARGLRCSNVMRALWDEMPEGQAADALARILRVHGADVREVRS